MADKKKKQGLGLEKLSPTETPIFTREEYEMAMDKSWERGFKEGLEMRDDDELVAALRSRGWQVIAIKTVNL